MEIQKTISLKKYEGMAGQKKVVLVEGTTTGTRCSTGEASNTSP